MNSKPVVPLSRIRPPACILLALFFFAYSQMAGQVAWNKQGGVCFRVDDNKPLNRLNDFDSIFSKYGFRFSMGMNSGGFENNPAYISGVKELISKGHEYMDHSPDHQTNYFFVADIADTTLYSGDPGVEHIRNDTICLKWSHVDTTTVSGEGYVNINGDQAISVGPGEFHDLIDPVYIPELYLPVTHKVYAWKDLQAVNPLDPDTLRLQSFWEEPVSLGTVLNTQFHKLTSYDIQMDLHAEILLGQRTLTICEENEIPRPYSWVLPFGQFPLFTSTDLASSMGEYLGYTAGATYKPEAFKCYDEYNPMGTKQFGMMFGDFKTETYTFHQNRSIIANLIVKHTLAIDLNHFVVPEPQWPDYLQRVDSLLGWLSANNIPVAIQRQWGAYLYDSVNNPVVNIFPLLQTDLDEDQVPDGYVLTESTLITDDGVPASGGRSLEIKKKGSFFNISNLGGLEKGVNHFSFYIRGDTANIISVVFWLNGTSQVSFDFSAGNPQWTQYTASLDIPDSVSLVNVEVLCQPYYGGFTRISGMTLRGVPRPQINHTPQVVTTNRQFGTLLLDTVITDPVYPLKNLTVEVTGGSSLNYILDLAGETLEVRKPSSFWIGKDSLYITATNPEGGSDNAWIVFEALPVEVCRGTQLTLTAFDTLPGATWQWESDPFDSTLTKPTNYQTDVRPGRTTLYTLYTNGPGGFFRKDTITVHVKNTTPVTISGLYPGYCINADPVTVITSPPGGVLTGSGITGNIFDPSQAATGPNKIIYTYTSPSGCTDADTVVVNIYPIPVIALPPVLTICYGETTTLDAGKNRDCYLWNDGSTDRFLTVDSSNLHGATSRQITVIVTDDGCAAFDTSLVNFIPCPGIGESSTAACLILYPNPFSGSFHTAHSCPPEVLPAMLLNLKGQEQFSFLLKPGNNEINVPFLPPGVYLLNIRFPDRQQVIKLVKIE